VLGFAVFSHPGTGDLIAVTLDRLNKATISLSTGTLQPGSAGLPGHSFS